MMRKSTTVQQWIAGSLICGALGVSACAPAQPPISRTSISRTSVTYLPQPEPVELRLAREELADARLALDAREYERALRLAERAMADARLAEARAVTESTRQAARDVRLSSEILRAEAARLAALY
jgi:hypothetical protein